MCSLLDPNLFQNEKCSEVIKICLNFYFKYADLDLDVKYDFYQYLPPVRSKFVPKLKVFKIIETCNIVFTSLSN